MLMAFDLMEEAESELAAGKPMKASEMLWGAVAHALIALAMQTGLPYDSHGALRYAARQVPNVPNRPHWLTEVDLADDCHRNFYHGHLTDAEVMRRLPRIRHLLVGVLTIAHKPWLLND